MCVPVVPCFLCGSGIFVFYRDTAAAWGAGRTNPDDGREGGWPTSCALIVGTPVVTFLPYPGQSFGLRQHRDAAGSFSLVFFVGTEQGLCLRACAPDAAVPGVRSHLWPVC